MIDKINWSDNRGYGEVTVGGVFISIVTYKGDGYAWAQLRGSYPANSDNPHRDTIALSEPLGARTYEQTLETIIGTGVKILVGSLTQYKNRWRHYLIGRRPQQTGPTEQQTLAHTDYCAIAIVNAANKDDAVAFYNKHHPRSEGSGVIIAELESVLKAPMVPWITDEGNLTLERE